MPVNCVANLIPCHIENHTSLDLQAFGFTFLSQTNCIFIFISTTICFCDRMQQVSDISFSTGWFRHSGNTLWDSKGRYIQGSCAAMQWGHRSSCGTGGIQGFQAPDVHLQVTVGQNS